LKLEECPQNLKYSETLLFFWKLSLFKQLKGVERMGNRGFFVAIIMIVSMLLSLFISSFAFFRFGVAQPQLNVDDIAVWSHYTGGIYSYDIYFSTYSYPALWVTPSVLVASLPNNDFWPAISFDRSGRAMAVWSHDTGNPTLLFDIYYSQWLGPAIGWTTPAPVASLADDDIDPAVALWYDGTGVVVWTRPSGELWYSLWNGAAWVGPATWLNSPAPWPSLLPTIHKQPEVAYDANHNAIAVWTDSDNPSIYGHVWYSVLYSGATSWTTPADLDPAQRDGVAYESRKGISPDRFGNAIAVWNADNLGWWDNQYSIWNGATFSPAAAIFPSFGIGISQGLGTAVAFDPANSATAVHGTDLIPPLLDIWSNRRVGGIWQPTQLVTPPPPSWNYTGFEPRIAHSRLYGGAAGAVWTGLNPLVGDNDIIYRVFDPSSGTWIYGGPVDPAGLPGDDGPWFGPVSVASASGSPTSPMFTYDVAVTNVTARTIISRGEKTYRADANVTVLNEGSFTETFDVSAYAANLTHTIEIGRQNGITLAPSAQTTLVFFWNTTGWKIGNYTISAYAWPVAGETDLADNTLAKPEQVILKLLGDLGGSVPPQFFKFDGLCDGKDLSLFLMCFKGTAPPGAMWLGDLGGGVPPRFFNYDNKCDGKDLSLFLICFKGGNP
jgi:hypothetical protein